MLQSCCREKHAVNDLRKTKGADDVIDIGVSVDGSWQRRGFSLLNGVVAAVAIDSRKIVDVEPMTRYCRQCFVNTRLLMPHDYMLYLLIFYFIIVYGVWSSASLMS